MINFKLQLLQIAINSALFKRTEKLNLAPTVWLTIIFNYVPTNDFWENTECHYLYGNTKFMTRRMHTVCPMYIMFAANWYGSKMFKSTIVFLAKRWIGLIELVFFFDKITLLFIKLCSLSEEIEIQKHSTTDIQIECKHWVMT